MKSNGNQTLGLFDEMSSFYAQLDLFKHTGLVFINLKTLFILGDWVYMCTLHTHMLLTSSCIYEILTLTLSSPLKGLSSPPLLIGCCRLMIQMVLLIDSCSTSPQKGVSTLMSWKSPYPKMVPKMIDMQPCMHAWTTIVSVGSDKVGTRLMNGKNHSTDWAI